jgi:hypothetical protein
MTQSGLTLEVKDLPELFGDDDFAAQDASLEAIARLQSKGKLAACSRSC